MKFAPQKDKARYKSGLLSGAQTPVLYRGDGQDARSLQHPTPPKSRPAELRHAVAPLASVWDLYRFKRSRPARGVPYIAVALTGKPAHCLTLLSARQAKQGSKARVKPQAPRRTNAAPDNSETTGRHQCVRQSSGRWADPRSTEGCL